MNPARLARWGGVFGLLASAAVVPAYLAGIPDAPRPGQSAEETRATAEAFVLYNGGPTFAHQLLFLLFIACLGAVVKRLTDNDVLAMAVLVGGVLYSALAAAGVAAEVAFQATQLARPAVTSDISLFAFAQTAAGWLYRFSQIGDALIILAVGAAAWRYHAFPRWIAWAGVVAIVLVLARPWVPLIAALASPTWILLLAAVMTFATGRTPRRAGMSD